jgi:hypothetical protein
MNRKETWDLNNKQQRLHHTQEHLQLSVEHEEQQPPRNSRGKRGGKAAL